MSIALIIVDMQRGMQNTDPRERNNLNAEKNIEKLLGSWRKNGQPVIHVRHISREPTTQWNRPHVPRGI
jgi:nicotinamidase-related amidase